MKRLAVMLTLLAALVVSIGVAVGRGDSGPGRDGPLDSGSLDLAYSVEVGEPHSIGIFRVRNHGKKPAVVDRVQLVGVRGPVELLGVQTRLFPADGNLFGALAGFPPAEFPATPLSDKNVVPLPTKRTASGEPFEALQFVIGVKMTATGTAAARGVDVTYRVGNKEYREFLQHHLWFCSPPSEYGEGADCPPPEEEDVFGDEVLG